MLQVFNFDTNTVRVVMDENGEPLFVAKDVAVALGYSDTVNAIKQHCDEGVVKHHPLQTAGGVQQVRVIDEPDVYSLIFGSKLESSKRFKKWVTSEVLPTIRKTGSYAIVKPEHDFELAKQTGLLSPAYVDMAKAFGFDGNQAYLSADKAIKQITGYSPLSLLGAELVSPVQAAVLVPSDIADRLGLKRQEPNKLLTAQGFQTNHRNHKDAIYYELTEKGKQYGEYVDTGLKHSDGSPRKQIKWFSTILEVLQTEALSK